jgi:hypothetical protein
MESKAPSRMLKNAAANQRLLANGIRYIIQIECAQNIDMVSVPPSSAASSGAYSTPQQTRRQRYISLSEAGIAYSRNQGDRNSGGKSWSPAGYALSVLRLDRL